MKKIDSPMNECYKCDGVDIDEIDTLLDNDGYMVKIVRCNECNATWEERWVFAYSLIEE